MEQERMEQERQRSGAAKQDAPEGPRMSRMQRVGSRWTVRDDALWNPFEVVVFLLWIIFAFGFLLGRDHYLFVVELFAPVIVFGATVVIVQAVLRWRAGEANVIRVLFRKLR